MALNCGDARFQAIFSKVYFHSSDIQEAIFRRPAMDVQTTQGESKQTSKHHFSLKWQISLDGMSQKAIWLIN